MAARAWPSWPKTPRAGSFAPGAPGARLLDRSPAGPNDFVELRMRKLKTAKRVDLQLLGVLVLRRTMGRMGIQEQCLDGSLLRVPLNLVLHFGVACHTIGL